MDNNRSFVQNITLGMTYVVNYSLAFFLFGFIFLNAIELYFKTPMPLAQSIGSFEHQTIVNDLLSDFGTTGVSTEAIQGQQFVRPEFMRVGRNDIQMPIDEEIMINEDRWVRPLTAHYTILNQDAEGNPGDILIYMKESWRTIPDSSVLTSGTNIMVESVGGGAIDYTVRENFYLNDTERFIPTAADSRQLILLISREDQTYSIIRAVSQTSKDQPL